MKRGHRSPACDDLDELVDVRARDERPPAADHDDGAHVRVRLQSV